MANDQDTKQARDLLKNFNSLDEAVKDKLLNGVKCLAFLQDLVDVKDDAEEVPVQPG